MAQPKITRAQAITQANAIAQRQNVDAEHAARLRVQFIDQWDSRWSRPENQA